MNLLIRSAVILAIIGATEASAQAASSDYTAVAQAVSDYHRALSRGDSARVLQLLAPDAFILESGGIESRAEYRSHHLPSDIGFAKTVASKRSPVRVTIEGNTAWTTSTSTTEGTYKGKAVSSSGAESMVLTKGPGGWKIRSIHWSSRSLKR